MSRSKAFARQAGRTPGTLRSCGAVRALLLGTVAALALAGCGPGTEPGAPNAAATSTATPPGASSPDSAPPGSAPAEASSPSPSGTAAPAAPPEREGDYTAELAITVVPEPGAEPVHRVLACNGTEPSEDSNVPEPAAACELIQKSAEALFFTAQDPTLQCTQQFGGPQTATITGTVDNRPVKGTFSLSDGCEISRWETLQPLLGSVGAM